MKPIKLCVKGLHSFREKQEVNFEVLCEGGVFGIFGPTGSGKSSLLDAMTLALYGKVERATNNTQGILNHAEDELFVSFTFQLGQGERTKRYEVERSFKRSGEISIRSATCRFLEVTGTPVVLADKAGDVNKGIEDLLGLSIDDFTRAVVLPQGKFSEFLSLKGNDRRQMLQRLFHLEKYGDELQWKLKNRLTKTKHEKELVEKEQLGLGNASKEALEEAKESLKIIKKEMVFRKSKLKKLEEQEAFEKEIVHWQEQKVTVEQQLEQLTSQEEKMSDDMQRLINGREAVVLLPYIKEWESSIEERDKFQQRVEEIGKKVEEVRHKTVVAEEEFNELKDEKEKNETRLRIRIEQLQQIKKEQELLQEEKDQLKALDKQLVEITEKIKKLEEDKNKADNDRMRYEEKQNELKVELQKVYTSSEYKKQIYQAIEKKQMINQIKMQLEEKAQEHEVIVQKKDKIEKNYNEQHDVLNLKHQVLKDRFSQIYHWYERISNEERKLSSLSLQLRHYKEDLEKSEQLELSKKLRAKLIDGQACPVCGSTEHPIEADEVGHTHHEIEEVNVSWIDEILEEINAEERNIDKKKWQLDEYSTKLKRFIDENVEISATVDEEVMNATQMEKWKGDKLEAIEEWRNQKNKLKKETEAIDQLFLKVNEDLNVYEELKLEFNDLSTNVKTVYERLEETKELTQQLKAKVNHMIEEWRGLFPQLNYEHISEEFKELQHKEEQTEQLRLRIEKSVPHIEEKQKKVEKHLKSIHELSIKESALKTEANQRKIGISKKEKEILESIEGNNVDILINNYSVELDSLLKECKNAENAYKHCKELEKKVEYEITTSNEALRHATQRLERAELNWNKQLQETSFKTSDEVKRNSLSADKIKELEDTINLFNDKKKQLQTKMEDCIRQLGDNKITSEKYKETLQFVEDTKGEIEQLGSKYGATESALMEMEKRVNRFEQLQQKLKVVEKEHSQLSKLDQVFRGKAFVEYVAEEQLVQVSRLASQRLHALTRGRYALEVDSNGGFVIRDDSNGGVKRPVSTLSGGETFLTSLALALALSASIQLKGEYPLQFFFLDEGFGTLDQDLLETVIHALEKLHSTHLSVGVISHVPELRERLPRKLIVTPSEAGGIGSRVRIENL
ncbi:AAA family ATPase [Evansella sp. AB-P1]|uniref:AAA family ATPase n=1 Tax=Evansella sp. AB-P1 TaxID=3037653 RepID=UPI00241E8218|nr:AAA family ATPase [Evansella sp. AB-P1]MDG5789673.1 AAA family ATPase [Evansella sp. AB-P1]